MDRAKKIYFFFYSHVNEKRNCNEVIKALDRSNCDITSDGQDILNGLYDYLYEVFDAYDPKDCTLPRSIKIFYNL